MSNGERSLAQSGYSEGMKSSQQFGLPGSSSIDDLSRGKEDGRWNRISGRRLLLQRVESLCSLKLSPLVSDKVEKSQKIEVWDLEVCSSWICGFLFLFTSSFLLSPFWHFILGSFSPLWPIGIQRESEAYEHHRRHNRKQLHSPRPSVSEGVWFPLRFSVILISVILFLILSPFLPPLLSLFLWCHQLTPNRKVISRRLCFTSAKRRRS